MHGSCSVLEIMPHQASAGSSFLCLPSFRREFRSSLKTCDYFCCSTFLEIHAAKSYKVLSSGRLNQALTNGYNTIFIPTYMLCAGSYQIWWAHTCFDCFVNRGFSLLCFVFTRLVWSFCRNGNQPTVSQVGSAVAQLPESAVYKTILHHISELWQHNFHRRRCKL
jgi:hypothetical protein